MLAPYFLFSVIENKKLLNKTHRLCYSRIGGNNEKEILFRLPKRNFRGLGYPWCESRRISPSIEFNNRSTHPAKKLQKSGKIREKTNRIMERVTLKNQIGSGTLPEN
jgi:hypothetical protein